MEHPSTRRSVKNGAAPGFRQALRGHRRRGDYEELLDRSDLDSIVLAENLRDLRLMNRGLGWTWSVWREIRPLLPPDRGEATLLDIATGSADVPRALVTAAAKEGRRLRATGSDLSAPVLAAARALNGGAGSRRTMGGAPGSRRGDASSVALVQHDATALPFADQSFDIVTLCLAAHHLDPDQLQRALAEMWRVARRGVVIGDLERSRPGYIAARLMALALRNQLTAHDGPISMLRAYTAPELAEFARRAGLERVRLSHPLPFRMNLTAHKLAGADPFAGRSTYPYLTAPLDLARASLTGSLQRLRGKRTAR